MSQNRIRKHHIALLLLVGFLCGPIGDAELCAQDEDDEMDAFELIEGPRWSRPSEGAGVGFGFHLTQLSPTDLDGELSGEFVPTSVDAYVILSGFVFGGSWMSTQLFDQPNSIDEFELGYKGLLLGYDHSLFYGRMNIRASVLLGDIDVTLIKSRDDITRDTVLNPGGLQVLERVWEDGSFLVRPAVGIGWAPSDVVQFRTEVSFLFPTEGARMEDLREPMIGFQIVFGPSR